MAFITHHLLIVLRSISIYLYGKTLIVEIIFRLKYTVYIKKLIENVIKYIINRIPIVWDCYFCFHLFGNYENINGYITIW